ncbi:HAD-IA family hydrolase [bacterium]|nr:HAD-IA family hydrolase [bacterium]
MKKIKAIIFDFGNVLANFDHMITCRKLAGFSPFSPEEIYQCIFKTKLEEEYDKGLVDSLTFYQQVKEKIQANSKLTWEVFKKIWGDIFSENSGIEKVLERIKPELKLFLLSNTNEIHWKYISQMPVIKHFFPDEKQLILSFKLGFRKPDIRIYKAAIKKADCPAEEIIYIDDITKYIQTAKKLGINGILYNCQKEPAAALLEKLKKFKVSKK